MTKENKEIIKFDYIETISRVKLDDIKGISDKLREIIADRLFASISQELDDLAELIEENPNFTTEIEELKEEMSISEIDFITR